MLMLPFFGIAAYTSHGRPDVATLSHAQDAATSTMTPADRGAASGARKEPDRQEGTPQAAQTVAANAQAAAMAATAQATSAINKAAAVSPLDFGLKCDAVEIPVTSPHGVYLYSHVLVGTDNTAALQATMKAACAQTSAATPIGAISEATAGSIGQAVIRFPYSCQALTTTVPPPCAGLLVEGQNASLLVSAPAGNGFVWTNTNAGNVPGVFNAVARNLRTVYVGTPGSSTGIGMGVLLGSQVLFDNVQAYGFRYGMVFGGVEYSNVLNSNFSHNTIGLALLPAGFNPPSHIDPNGQPTIQNGFIGVTTRNNTVNHWLAGASQNVFVGGSLSFGANADVVFGAIDFKYVSGFMLSGAAVCTPNSTIPLTVTDAAALVKPAGILVTDGHGVPSAYQTNGGYGVDSHITVRVPTTGAASCSTPPVVTARVSSMPGAFAGESSKATAANLYYMNNLENEGIDSDGVHSRPSVGAQIVSSPVTSDNLFYRPINGLGDGTPEGFAHFWTDLGLNNETDHARFALNLDPVTGARCPIIETQGHQLDVTRQTGAPDALLCGSDGLPDYSSRAAIDGWKINMRRSHGWSALGSGAGNADYEPAFEADEPGDTQERFKTTPSGRMSFGTGAAAPDVTLGRLMGSALGGIWGPISGGYANAPVVISLGNGKVPNFAVGFASTNANSSTYPQPGSSGIPKGFICVGRFVWNGNGSGPSSWAYGASASCTDGQTGTETHYKSIGHPLGSEVWKTP